MIWFVIGRVMAGNFNLWLYSFIKRKIEIYLRWHFCKQNNNNMRVYQLMDDPLTSATTNTLGNWMEWGKKRPTRKKRVSLEYSHKQTKWATSIRWRIRTPMIFDTFNTPIVNQRKSYKRLTCQRVSCQSVNVVRTWYTQVLFLTRQKL